MNDPIAPMFGRQCGPWHLTFAWWPVRCDDAHYAWMRFVWRRRIVLHEYLDPDGGIKQWWQYARFESSVKGWIA